MKFRRSTLFTPLSLLGDTMCLTISFFLGYYLRFGNFDNSLTSPYLLLYLAMNAFWFLLLLIVKPFNESRVTFNFFKLTYKFIIILSLHIALVALFWVLVKGSEISRLHLLYTYILTFVFGITFRGTGVYLLKYLRMQGFNIRRYAILGYGELSKTIFNYYQNHPEMGYEFHGYYDDNATISNVDTIESLNNKVLDNSIDYIYCCLPYIDNSTLKEIIAIAEFKKCQVKLLMDFRGFATKGISIEYHDYLPIINVHSSPFSDTKVIFLKRVFDIFFSLVAIVLLLPVYSLIALITKFTSQGPIIYSQERVGQWGKPFKIYKFRSMYIDAEKGTPKLSQGKNDSRITPWGRFMRKTRLDELPQFFNVLKGDMSVVGPRPERQFFIDQIVLEEPEYTKLLSLKPGITSIGQVKYGYASNVQEMIDRFKIDVQYLSNKSIKTDIEVIIQTIKVMTLGKGK